MSNELVKQDHYLGEFEYAKKVGQMIVKSGKFAKDWNEDTVGILVLYAKDLGIHPVTALINGFDIIQGKISMKPILMNNMIRRKGHSIEIVKNDNEECILRGTRKDTGDTCTIRFGMDDAKRAGIASKSSFTSWQSDMLYNRAMGRLGRMLFADVIGGAYTSDEMDDIKATAKAKKKEQEEMTLADVEISNVDEKVSDTVPIENHANVPTLDDLHLALVSLGTECDKQMLEAFVRLSATRKGKSETDIIISALLNEDMLKLFNDLFLKSLEEKAK